MKAQLKRSACLILILNIAFLAVEIAFFILISTGSIVASVWSLPATVFSFIAIALNALAMWKFKIDVTDFRFLFMVFMYIFMCGRVWLNCFGLDGDIFWVLHTFFPHDVMARASMYCLCCIQAIFLGLLCTKQKMPLVYERNSEYTDSNRLFLTGILLLLIGLPCQIYVDIHSIRATLSSGSYLSITGVTGLIDDFAFLLIPGILCLMESRPKQRKVIFGAIGAYFLLVMSLTGNRRYYVTSIVAIGAYLLYVIRRDKPQKEKISIKRYVFIGILGVLFLSFLQVLREIRVNGLGSLSEFLINHGSDIFVVDDLLYEVLAEFGISFFSVTNIIANVPTMLPFQYGMTFVGMLPFLLPVGFLLGDLFVLAEPSAGINAATVNGLGSTLLGDLYANFGSAGILFSFLFGIILSKIVNLSKREQGGIKLVMYYSLYRIMINLVRCTVFEVYRPSIWMYCIVYIIYWSFGKKKDVKLL